MFHHNGKSGKADTKAFDELMQFVLKNNEHRPDCVVILRGKNLCAQAENLVFHMTRGAVVQTIL